MFITTNDTVTVDRMKKFNFYPSYTPIDSSNLAKKTSLPREPSGTLTEKLNDRRYLSGEIYK
jgi:hypothetical protein